MARWALAPIAVLLLLAASATARADDVCSPTAGGNMLPVAFLVSMVGDVVINGRPPTGRLPNAPICPGDTLTVGTHSRAAVYLIGADTPLRLDENTVSRFDPPPEPSSGLIELVRGGLYFLSEVRRTLTVRTPYVNAGVEGTEVYLRVGEAGAQMIVLEGRVGAAPGADNRVPFAATTVSTGQRLEVAPDAVPSVTALPDDGVPFGALRRVTVGSLSWTLFYPEMLVGVEAQDFPRIEAAARLLAAGQSDQAEAELAKAPKDGAEAGLAATLRTSISVARSDSPTAQKEAARAVALAPAAAAPRLALSYARQLALDLDGAIVAAAEAAALASNEPLPQARLAELYLMQGEVRRSRQAADAAARLGASPLTDIAQGFAALAALRGAAAEAAFRRALQQDSQNPSAQLELGIALIKQGDLAAGTVQIQNAAVADPSSSLLRSYLGKAFFTGRDDVAAAKQYAIAKALDPNDPTPWLYDAIRLQLANQPVAALKELDRSIALNDQRATFRSQALLDQDQSARGAALARVYRDLGFEQLGVNTAAWSLAADPASPSAHRFLSDLYFGVPRLESARASELLQSQLLQGPNLQPLQPSLPFTDLDLVADAGPRTAGFNEFTPLFVGNGIRLDGAGTVGSQQTAAGEAALATLVGRTSVSAGIYHYETDGFRRDFDVDHDIQSVFAQTLLTDELGLQAEYRHRQSHGGDRRLLFDLDNYERSLRQDIDQSVFRLGGKYDVGPSSSIVTSYIHSDDNRKEELDVSGADQNDELDTTTDQEEAQYLTRLGPAKIVSGVSHVKRDGSTQRSFNFDDATFPFSDDDLDASGTEIYSLATISARPGLDVSVRLGWSWTEVDDDRVAEDVEMSGFTPGLGVAWTPTDTGTTLRAAASRTIKAPYAGNQTLRPTQLAGFNQLLDEFETTRADQLNLAVEQQVGADLNLGATSTFRWLTRELVGEDGGVDLGDAQDNRAVLFAYWAPTEQLAFSLAPSYEWYDTRRKEVVGDPYRVRTWTVPLTAAWFHPSGLYAFAGGSLLKQDVTIEADVGSESEDDWGVLVDVGVGYRLPRRYGTIGLRIDNLLDQDVSFQDESLRTDADLNPRFLPSQSMLLTATLNF